MAALPLHYCTNADSACSPAFHSRQVEVLLYLTPLHHRDMTTSMSNNLNDVYLRFIRRNPNFQVGAPRSPPTGVLP